MNAISLLGQKTLSLCENTGKFFIFVINAFWGIMSRPFYTKQVIGQIIEIGYFSLPVVGLTAIFTGAVLALQSYAGFQRFAAESAIATVVVLSITRELGPVMAGLMVSGRVGSAMAAEISTMKTTEQIDALKTLSTDPVRYLISPRVLASIITMPLLVLVANIIGVLGGYIVAVYSLDFNPEIYLKNTLKYLEFYDVVQGLVKAAVFGALIAIVSCYCGYNAKNGAKEVGVATTSAVVLSSIAILLFNYLITQIFFG